MPRRPNQPKEWFRLVAETMAREGVSIKTAAMELKLNLTAEELDRVSRLASFQQILREERHRFQTEVARTPGMGKESIIGMLLLAIQKLLDAGEWDKAVAATEKLAKIAGWLGSETNINVLAGLTSKDIELAKEKVKKELLESGHPQSPLSN